MIASCRQMRVRATSFLLLSAVASPPLAMLTGCGRPGLVPPGKVGSVEVQAAFRPSTPGSFDPLQLAWEGRWIAQTSPSQDGSTQSAAESTLPATQQSELYAFPRRAGLRAGRWQLCLTAQGNGTPVIQQHCTAEIVRGQTNRVQFTEGSLGCACTLPCEAPDPDAEIFEACPD